MKQFNMLKVLFVAALIGAVNVAFAQVHPLAFGPHTLSGSTTMSSSNWYLNYVGKRVVVTQPSSIAGDKINAESAIGTGSGQWPNIHDTDLFNIPIKMDTTSDSFAGVGFAPGYFAGKIAVLWRGPIGGPFTFTLKAMNAQQAGALAVILIDEYPGQAPFAPGYSTGVGTVTIPVYMISNTDGIAISGVYHSSPAGTVKMSLTNWGEGLTNDLGIITNGAATWHNYALPYSQFAAGSTSLPYKALDGAFVANFGTDSAASVKLVASTYFTPTGGSTPATPQHKDSIVSESVFIGAANSPAIHPSDTTSDSVFAMFTNSAASLYNLTASGTGRFDVVYNLSSSLVDQSLGDNSATVSFYLTDSIYSKGHYDFVNNLPERAIYEGFGGGAEFTWGPMYYVAKGGDTVSKIQYSIAANTAGPLSGGNDVYFFKWVDGSNGQPKDSIMQNGELDLVSWSTKNYGTLDTSEATLTLSTFNDSNNFNPIALKLDSNTWYYVAIDLTQSTTASPLFLGCDGFMDPYPRVFGRWFINPADLEYNSVVATNLADIQANPASNNGCLPASEVSFIRVIDSFNYANEKGLIPAVALTIKKYHADTTSHVGVHNISLAENVTVYPNPANDHMDVSINMDQVADKVTYKVMDGLGRIVGKIVHNNVQSETLSINTATLSAGTYFLLITADETKHVSRKFTVIH